jgi:hypothetical protein
MTPFLVLVMGIAMLLGAACSSGKATDNSNSAAEDKSTTPVVDAKDSEDTEDTEDTLITSGAELCLTPDEVQTLTGGGFVHNVSTMIGTTATPEYVTCTFSPSDNQTRACIVCTVVVFGSKEACVMWLNRGIERYTNVRALDIGDEAYMGIDPESAYTSGGVRIDNALVLVDTTDSYATYVEAMLRIVASKR